MTIEIADDCPLAAALRRVCDKGDKLFGAGGGRLVELGVLQRGIRAVEPELDAELQRSADLGWGETKAAGFLSGSRHEIRA